MKTLWQIRKAASLVSLSILFSVFTAQGAVIGIYETYAVLKINGSGNQFYDANATTVNPDFQNATLGTFNPLANSLILNGAEVKTLKNNGGDVFGAFIAYRVFASGNPSGTFTESALAFHQNLGGGNQIWQTTTANINLLSGLNNGNYILEIYFRANGNTADVFDSRNGNNYQASFSVVPEPTNIALAVFGGLAVCFVVLRRILSRPPV